MKTKDYMIFLIACLFAPGLIIFSVGVAIAILRQISGVCL